MAEGSSKSTLMKALAPLDPQAIESPMTGLGIPDVNCTKGWIECKAMKKWPKGCDTNPVQFPHPLTKEQQIWLYRRELRGGLAMVCAKVSSSWFFFHGMDIKKKNLWGNMTRPEMIANSALYFKNGLDKQALLDYLIKNG